jgi:hypothetical protein
MWIYFKSSFIVNIRDLDGVPSRRPAAEPANFGFCGPQNEHYGNPSTRPSTVPGNTKNICRQTWKNIKKL